MTNYNERLDEIVLGVYNEAYKCGVGARPYHEYRSVEAVAAEAKQAFTSLIKELVAEAKPKRSENELGRFIIYGDLSKRDLNIIHRFEQNLLKALEEV